MLATLFTIGVVWLTYGYMFEGQQSLTVCPSKWIYHWPCPTCGTTRACLLLMHGHFVEAFWKNPNVIPAMAFMVGSPVVGIYDFFTGKHVVRAIFQWIGRQLKRRWLFALVLVCEGLIWAHNIYIGN